MGKTVYMSKSVEQMREDAKKVIAERLDDVERQPVCTHATKRRKQSKQAA